MKKAAPVMAPPWPSQLKPLIEESLDRFLPSVDTQPEPLHRAMRHAVFAGGKRVRPQFLLRVAEACQAPEGARDLTLRAACAVELIHAASLVHDDLPCFDNAAERRGLPTVHVLFGEARALLVGDALLARSFEILAGAPRAMAARTVRLVQLLATATGSTSGLVGGQGLEHDSLTGMVTPGSSAGYHALKSGALFAMAAEAAAVAAGAGQTTGWSAVGWLVGRGYQLVHTAPAPRAEAALQEQVQKLRQALHERITALTPEPAPLITFLDELCSPLLSPARAPAAVVGGQPAPEKI